LGQIFKIDESTRDDELGLFKKQITCDSNSFCIDTPIVSHRANKIDPEIKVQEIIRHIDDKVVKSLDARYIKTYTDAVKTEWASDKLNLTLFDFKYNDFPDDESLKTISHALHGASDKVILLPTVKKKLLMETKPNHKTPSLSLDKIETYKKMMKVIIDETTKPQNGKQIVGMVPFLPWLFTKPIVDFYCSEGIRAFAIDCGFRDIMEYKDDFARVLTRVKETVTLDKTVLFAFNAGVPSSFEATEVVSDDFLGVFAYVDILGSTFKSRGGKSGGEGEKQEPKARVFSRDKYSYDITTYPNLRPTFGSGVNFYTIRNFNKMQQLRETAKLRELVGVEKIKKYLSTKKAVNQESMSRLESIAKKVG
jgi:hypothetical protein